MSTAGPELPPHLLAKRKRQAEEEERAAAQSKDNGVERSQSPEGGEKRRRVVGPAPPPGSLDELPAEDPSNDDDSSSSSEDEFGPAVPPADAPTTAYPDSPSHDSSYNTPSAEPASKKVARDEWMMLPPTQDGLAARMDPTKLRARKFNSGKGARAPGGGGGDNAMWTETPEEKRKRLENEVLGISAPESESTRGAGRRKDKAKEEEMARKLEEHTKASRGPSLYEQHSARTDREKEDDPSARGFDWEKDMKAGSKIGHAQRRDMVNRASNMNSKFSSGGFL